LYLNSADALQDCVREYERKSNAGHREGRIIPWRGMAALDSLQKCRFKPYRFNERTASIEGDLRMECKSWAD
jgi:hypothetical protein